MKTRSRLLLAAVSLLTVSVAATATSAYAWYTANRQVSANLTQMGVQATSGTLSIEHATGVEDSFKTGVSNKEDNYNLVASASGKALTDVSSKGDGKFIKPKFSHDNKTIVGDYTQTGENIGQKTVKLSNGVAAGESTATEISAYGVISLAITISNSAATGADSLDVYIDPTKTSLTSTLDSAENSARFSIIEVGGQTNPYMYCSPTAVSETPTADASESTTVPAKEGYKYIEKTTQEGKVSFSEKELSDTSDGLIQDKGKDKLFTKKGVVASSSSTTKNKPNGYLCTLGAGSSKTYLITMWVEGTDPDCKVGETSLEDSILVSDLSLKLGLYALEA